jgi:hypothetical protein
LRRGNGANVTIKTNPKLAGGTFQFFMFFHNALRRTTGKRDAAFFVFCFSFFN